MDERMDGWMEERKVEKKTDVITIQHPHGFEVCVANANDDDGEG